MLARQLEAECLWGPKGEGCVCAVAEVNDEGKHDVREEGGGRGVEWQMQSGCGGERWRM